MSESYSVNTNVRGGCSSRGNGQSGGTAIVTTACHEISESQRSDWVPFATRGSLRTMLSP